ncbi:hypothetical protein SDC9_185211 [bioreactor metagenome]|uniref:Uncharacterized protein n=1 Tax=bioreactor metagenome TaxID=1076179 RepID=A0A645HFB2_9ZZZZ
MKNIKTDASFESTGGVGLIHVGKIKFIKDKAVFIELCLFNELNNIYRIDSKNVNKEEIGECLKKQDKKGDVEWYTYNETNLKKYFIS